MGQCSWAAEGSIDASVSLGNGTKASAGATLRCAAVAGLISSSEREPLSKLRRLEKCGLGFSNSENSETLQHVPKLRANTLQSAGLIWNLLVVLEQLTAKNSETHHGAHAARKHLATSSHSFPTLP